MSNRQQRTGRIEVVKPAGGAAMKLQLRRSAGRAHDFDVAPEHALRMSGAERFHRRFFRSEAAGEVRRWVSAPGRIRNFPVREDPADKSIAITLDGGVDAIDFRRIHPYPDNIGGSISGHDRQRSPKA